MDIIPFLIDSSFPASQLLACMDERDCSDLVVEALTQKTCFGELKLLSRNVWRHLETQFQLNGQNKQTIWNYTHLLQADLMPCPGP